MGPISISYILLLLSALLFPSLPIFSLLFFLSLYFSFCFVPFCPTALNPANGLENAVNCPAGLGMHSQAEVFLALGIKPMCLATTNTTL